MAATFQRHDAVGDGLIGGGSALQKVRSSPFERLSRGEMNRKQRRELGRKVAADEPGLTIENPNAGGIDVGNESHFVAVPPDRDAEPVREFGCWTEAVVQMAEWLQACRVDTVTMQATGMYSAEVPRPEPLLR